MANVEWFAIATCNSIIDKLNKKLSKANEILDMHANLLGDIDGKNKYREMDCVMEGSGNFQI
ncbi:MAG: hypothetical protein QXD11_02095 [Candidatus Micrarchaeaceae archaeon]